MTWLFELSIACVIVASTLLPLGALMASALSARHPTRRWTPAGARLVPILLPLESDPQRGTPRS
ncbi:hypothetical protein [Caulobacter soli]|uniref:hypothetical protein n=1 Tax=Caulobacter soli TaxID=2708539 RepID=UPI0013EB37CE|nr:hypothetical protein [Caulobacter soli]